MPEFVRRARRRTEISYTREFRYRDSEYAGFGFPCDAAGNVDRDALPAPARSNLDRCLAGELDVVDLGVRRDEHRWTEPAVLRCDCGADVVLGHFTNACPVCPRDYDSAGSLLAPGDQWGEETGEALSEILRTP